MSPVETVLVTAGVVVLLAVVAPFTRSPQRGDPAAGSEDPPYLLLALAGVNLAVLGIGVSVAAAATFFG